MARRSPILAPSEIERATQGQVKPRQFGWRPVRPASGKASGPGDGQRLQWYETGEDPPDPTRAHLIVLHLASLGWHDSEIATALGMTYLGIRARWRRIFELLGTTGSSPRGEAVAIALRRGLIE